MRWATMTLEWGVKQYCAAVIPHKRQTEKERESSPYEHQT